MAKNVKINNVTYSEVPYVKIPLATGSGDATYYDVSDATLNSTSQMLSGVTAYTASGQKLTGNLNVPSISQDSTSKALTIS